MVGKNIAKWLETGELPKTVSKYGHTRKEIFVCYEELKEKVPRQDRRDPARGGGDLHLRPEVQDRASADHGRDPELQPREQLPGAT